MNNPHESEQYLVNWAKAKALDFEERSSAWLTDESTFELFSEFKPETQKQLIKIRLGQPMPWELRGIASDAVKAIRDALDQCCLHCTQRINNASGRSRKGKNTHFPFGETPSDFDDVLAGKAARQSKDIAPELHRILRTFEPYPTGNGHTGGNERLRHIGRVSGPNKHELTLVVGLTTDSFHFGKVSPMSGHGFSLMAPFWDRLKNEAVVGETNIDAHLHIELGVSSFIEFDHPLIGRYPVHLILRQWSEITEDIVARLIAETDQIIGS